MKRPEPSPANTETVVCDYDDLAAVVVGTRALGERIESVSVSKGKYRVVIYKPPTQTQQLETGL